MDSLYLLILSCMVLGAVVGFLAGLLGIGGGIVAVPVLIYLLPSAGFEVDNVPHVAIATSLAAIILTSFSSATAHHKRGNIPWSLFKFILPGLVLGAISAGFISQRFSATLLQQTFALFVIFMAIQMVFPFKVKESHKTLPAGVWLFTASLVIAIIAAMMGIGGGILLIPFLSWCGLKLREAIGFSSASGGVIALFGSASYVLAGWNISGLPEWTLGFVYLPALFGVVLTSVLMAPLGVKAACVWPTPVLKKIFALLLIIVGVKLALT